MEKNRFQNILKEKFGSEYIATITFNGKKYIQGMDIRKGAIKYYEILENAIVKVKDEELLLYFKKVYECKNSDVIY